MARGASCGGFRHQSLTIIQLAEPLRAVGHKVKVGPLSSGLAFLARRGARWDGAADPRRGGNFASRH